jgi:hypothetical protein
MFTLLGFSHIPQTGLRNISLDFQTIKHFNNAEENWDKVHTKENPVLKQQGKE